MGTLAMQAKVDGVFFLPEIVPLLSCFPWVFYFLYKLSCVLITALITNKQIHI